MKEGNTTPTLFAGRKWSRSDAQFATAQLIDLADRIRRAMRGEDDLCPVPVGELARLVVAERWGNSGALSEFIAVGFNDGRTVVVDEELASACRNYSRRSREHARQMASQSDRNVPGIAAESALGVKEGLGCQTI